MNAADPGGEGQARGEQAGDGLVVAAGHVPQHEAIVSEDFYRKFVMGILRFRYQAERLLHVQPIQVMDARVIGHPGDAESVHHDGFLPGGLASKKAESSDEAEQPPAKLSPGRIADAKMSETGFNVQQRHI